MTFRSSLLALLLAACPAAAETMPAGALAVIDGDTVKLARQGQRAERIRLLGIDAPETHRASCGAERALARKARERLATLLREGAVVITRRGVDRFGRTLAVITIEGGRDVGLVLVGEGLALPWRPGREAMAARKQQWCGG